MNIEENAEHNPAHQKEDSDSASTASSFWNRAKWKAEISSKRLEIVSAVIGLFVSAGLIGFLLPVKLDEAAIERDNVQRCWESAMDVRQSINAVEDGFIVQPAAPVPRRADLRNTKSALQNAAFACAHVSKVANNSTQIDSLITRTGELMSQSDRGEFRTRTDFEATKYVVDVRSWVDDSLRRLTI